MRSAYQMNGPTIVLLISHLLAFAASVGCDLGTAAVGRSINGMDVICATSKTVGLLLHIDVATVFLTACPNLIQFVCPKTLGLSYRPFSPNQYRQRLAPWILFWALLHTGLSWSIVAAGTTRKGFDFATHLDAIFVTGVGWSGHALLVLLIFGSAAISAGTLGRSFSSGLWSALLLLFWAVHVSYAQSLIYKRLAAWHGAWLLSVTGFIVYALEILYCEIWITKKSNILKLVNHPSSVCELYLDKRGISPKIGQSIQICFPDVSTSRFYSFTLTSAPEDDFLSIHSSGGGDDDKDLARWLRSQRLRADMLNHRPTLAHVRLGIEAETASTRTSMERSCPQAFIRGERFSVLKINQPSVGKRLRKPLITFSLGIAADFAFTGPFGSPAQDIFKAEVATLVAEGSDVTICSSILKSIWYRASTLRQTSRLRKVYFFWVCDNFRGLEWFSSLLLALEAQDAYHLLEIHKVRCLNACVHSLIGYVHPFQETHTEQYLEQNAFLGLCYTS